MVMSLVMIGVVGVLGYMWASRGFLSALMHLLCVVTAGAIAFSVWEPVALLLLGVDGGQNELLNDLSWGAGLGLPFLIALVLLRVAADKLVPANADVDGGVNFAGGAVCGALSGVIVAGMLLLSVGYTRMSTDLYGYKPLDHENDGSLVVKSNLILPVEKLTAKFYSMLSNGTFRPIGGQSLGRLRPEMAYEGALLRTSFEEGKGRNTLPPSAFEVLRRYTYAPGDSKQLFIDTFDEKRQQSFTNLAGEVQQAGSSQIEGFVVTFRAGAKEKGGNFIVGPGQMRLVVQTNPNDPLSTIGVQPLAVISQASNKNELGRWRWDAPMTFFQSVGGASDATMAFEFVVPKGSTPVGLYVKGVRADVSGMAPTPTFTSMSERDAAIRSKAILAKGGGGGGPSTAAGPAGMTIRIRPEDAGNDIGIRVNSVLPFNIILQKDNANGLELDDSNENAIIGGGLVKFNTSDLKNSSFVDRKLQVRTFGATDDTRIVQVKVDGSNTRFGLLSDAAANIDRSKAPALVDANGTSYTPVGYVFRNNEETHIYFSPQQPVAAVSGMPAISRSRPDAQLYLVYRVTFGVNITKFTIGDKIIAEFTPGVRVEGR